MSLCLFPVGGVFTLVYSEICPRWTCLLEFWVRESVCPSVFQPQPCRRCLILMEKQPQREVRHITSAHYWLSSALLQTTTWWSCVSSTEPPEVPTLKYHLKKLKINTLQLCSCSSTTKKQKYTSNSKKYSICQICINVNINFGTKFLILNDFMDCKKTLKINFKNVNINYCAKVYKLINTSKIPQNWLLFLPYWQIFLLLIIFLISYCSSLFQNTCIR